MSVYKLQSNPVHLGLGATADVEPEFTGELSWYEGYSSRHDSDGAEGRLVSMHSFSASWDVWEMHPEGAEMVLCVAGSADLLQDNGDGGVATLSLRPGEYAVNPPGVWHTADVGGEATLVFITAGKGTLHRPR